jgi:hypothetical protein
MGSDFWKVKKGRLTQAQQLGSGLPRAPEGEVPGVEVRNRCSADRNAEPPAELLNRAQDAVVRSVLRTDQIVPGCRHRGNSSREAKSARQAGSAQDRCSNFAARVPEVRCGLPLVIDELA